MKRTITKKLLEWKKLKTRKPLLLDGARQVGKTYNLELTPMTFYEFLLASHNKMLIKEFEHRVSTPNTHKHLWKMLLDYYYTGGMPEAVNAWYSNESTIDQINRVDQIHKDLMIGYKMIGLCIMQ